jgi:hypothetical protein
MDDPLRIKVGDTPGNGMGCSVAPKEAPTANPEFEYWTASSAHWPPYRFRAGRILYTKGGAAEIN